MLVMAQAASKTVLSSKALYCLQYVLAASVQRSHAHQGKLLPKMCLLYLMTRDFARQLPTPASAAVKSGASPDTEEVSVRLGQSL